MKKIYIAICISVVGAFTANAQQEAPHEMLGNITYVMYYGPYEERVKLENGKYKEKGYVYIYYRNKYVCGDFNNDGVQDIAALYSRSGGGSGTFYRLVFLINEKGKYIHKGTCYLGDRVVIYSLKEDRGKVIVDMLTHSEGDGRAVPTKRVQNVYEYCGKDIYTR